MKPEIEITFDETQDLTPPPQQDLLQVQGAIQTFSSTPTHIPKTIIEQIILTSTKLYIYDTVNNTWKYASLN